MLIYIITSGLYRLSCGALILAINWMIAVDNQSFKWLAILIALTFLPAMVVPLIWKSHKNTNGDFITGICLIMAAVLSVALYVSINKNLYFILVINTLLWLFFFVMESSWESWFTKLARKYSDGKTDRYSSLSMSVNQACLMTGPIVVGFAFKNKPQIIFIVSAIVFLCSGLYTIFLSKRDTSCPAATHTEKTEMKESVVRLSGYEISLILIWPTLAMFNFMLPVQVIFHHGSMADVGILDAIMGLGMIAAGGLFGYSLIRKYLFKYHVNLLLIILACAFWLTGSGMISKGISIFILGVIFNVLRIMLRSYLARTYPASVVGGLVSGANSLSFFIIAMALFLFHQNLHINWLIPFIFTGLMCILLRVKAGNLSLISNNKD